MWGFGKAAGPAAPPASQPSFGNYPSPPTPSSPAPPPPAFPHSSPPRSPGTCGFSLANSRAEAVQRVLSPSSTFGSTKPAATPYPLFGAHRPVDSSSGVANVQRSFFKSDMPVNPRASATTSFVASHNSGSSITAKIVRFQDPQKTSSLDLHVNHGNHGNHLVPPRIRSPSFASENYYVDHDRPLGEGPRAALSPPAQGLQPKMLRTYSDLLDSEDKTSVSPVVGFLDSTRSLTTEAADVQAPKQTRSSPIPASNEIFLESNRFLQKEFSRPSIAPPRPITRPNASLSSLHSQIPQRSMSSVNSTTIEAVPTKVSGFSIAKRARSPPTSSTNEVFQGNSHSTQDDSEREIQAKAKRLARFKKELTESFETIPDTVDKKFSVSRSEESMVETQKSAGDNNNGSREDFSSHLNSSDLESLEMSSIIVGSCPDMCPGMLS
uniref:80 kD MCM3-associated protein n=1 Tax=Rhizophora mucronata TaxID=61149 RepID=A0A2P2KUG9_RHIMU